MVPQNLVIRRPIGLDRSIVKECDQKSGSRAFTGSNIIDYGTLKERRGIRL
jgi:hypothetical protein